MESINNKKQHNDQSKNTVITLKVSNVEKALLQEMAEAVDLSLSEYLRLKGLSNLNSVTNFEKELEEKENEIKKLKIALAFYEGNKVGTPGIALPLTEIQEHELYMIFSNYYDSTTQFEKQIIRYLIEDLFTPHYQFEKHSILDIGLNVQNALKPIKAEIPAKNCINHTYLAELFSEYGTFRIGNKVLDQIKAPNNKRTIEVWEPSKE